MSRTKTLLLAGALLSLMAGNPVQAEDSAHSLALQVALATGLTDPAKGPLFDTPRSELPAALRDLPNHHAFNDALDVGLYSTLGLLEVGGSYTAWARGGRASVDMANLAAFGLGLLLHSPTQPHPATRPQVIAWLPAGPAGARRAERDAGRAARDELTAAMLAAAIAAMPEGSAVEYTDAHANRPEHVVRGPDYCDPVRGVRCRLGTGATEPVRARSLDGEESWHWRNWQPGDTRSARTAMADYPAIWVVPLGKNAATEQLLLTESHDYAARFSAHLPASVYVYMPPSEQGPAAIFHQGVVHYFIEPAGEHGAGP